jgi:hypothetical protein
MGLAGSDVSALSALRVAVSRDQTATRLEAFLTRSEAARRRGVHTPIDGGFMSNPVMGESQNSPQRVSPSQALPGYGAGLGGGA